MAQAGYLFINNSLLITQNTNLYGEYINEGTYDYTFQVNLSGVANDITHIFSNATYIQNSNNPDNYDINLVIPDSVNFANWSSGLNNRNTITLDIGSSNVAFTTLDPSVLQTFGDRLLEVVAHKIFGHGQARAAISNDREFYTHDGELWNHLSNSVLNSDFRNDIFNQYVSLGRYENTITERLANDNTYNDMNTYINFNFIGLSFDFPMFLAGNILLNNTLTNDEVNLFVNGPNVGGTLLNNGAYNVPILVKFRV